MVEVGEALNDAMKENRVRVSETRIPKGSGDQVIQLIGAPLKNAGDELVGAVLVLHDVSNLRALEAVRQDFVANISHELKTPLAAIRGLVETLVDDRDMDADIRRRVQLEAVHRPEIDVEQQAIHRVGASGPEELFRGPVGLDRVPHRPEQAGERPPHSLVVLHDGDPCRPGCDGH